MSEQNSTNVYPINVQPTAERLQNLGEGCFVRVCTDHGCQWVEITDVEGETCSGVLHKELNNSALGQAEAKLNMSFSKDKIIDLGCDRYCFC